MKHKEMLKLLQVKMMESKMMNTAIEYGFYYAPVFNYYFSTSYFAWKKSYSSNHRIGDYK